MPGISASTSRDDSNRLFDFEASYYDVNVHRGDAAGTTEFAVTGYGLDESLGRGDYLCQWKMLTGDLHEQSVDAETPDTSTSVRCTTPWWDSRGSSTRVSAHKLDRFGADFDGASLEHTSTRQPG